MTHVDAYKRIFGLSFSLPSPIQWFSFLLLLHFHPMSKRN